MMSASWWVQPGTQPVVTEVAGSSIVPVIAVRVVALVDASLSPCLPGPSRTTIGVFSVTRTNAAPHSPQQPFSDVPAFTQGTTRAFGNVAKWACGNGSV